MAVFLEIVQKTVQIVTLSSIVLDVITTSALRNASAKAALILIVILDLDHYAKAAYVELPPTP